MDISSGTILAERYKIISKLGAGSMGSVYLAEDTDYNGNKVALKILHSHISSEIQIIERFKQEIRLAKQLSHPNIVRYYELGELPQKQYYLSMEYFEGISLADLYNQKNISTIQFEWVLVILYNLSAALFHMHSNNIIHRDIKPGNILIGSDGRVKITDLGIARSLLDESNLTGFDQMIGTPSYMAPERFIKAQKVTHLADIYSFGILAYWLVSGSVPFQGENSMVYMWQHILQPLPDLNRQGFNIPAWYQKFVEACTVKNPQSRSQSMAEIALLLYKEICKLNIKVEPPEVLLDKYKAAPAAKLSTTIKRICLRSSSYFIESGQNWKNLPIAILISLFSLLLFVQLPAYQWSGILEAPVEHRLLDLFFKIRGQRETPRDVIVVSITDKSIQHSQTGYMQPFDRNQYIQLLQKIHLAHAKKVIFDLLFQESIDRNTDQRLAETFEITPTFIARFRAMQENTGKDNETKWLIPNELFTAHAAGIFDGSLKNDNGIIRRFMPTYEETPPYTSFANIAFGQNFTNNQIPTSRDFINYYGGPATIKTYTLYDILNNKELSPDLFKDQVILVGLQMNLFNPYQNDQPPDSFVTSLGTNTYGVEIHASVIANLLDQSWIKSMTLNYQAIATIFLSIITSLIILKFENQRARLLASLFIATSLGLSYLCFINYLYIPVCSYIFAVILSLIMPRAKSIYERTSSLFIPRNADKIAANPINSGTTLS